MQNEHETVFEISKMDMKNVTFQRSVNYQYIDFQKKKTTDIRHCISIMFNPLPDDKY